MKKIATALLLSGISMSVLADGYQHGWKVYQNPMNPWSPAN
jgi:hypothetical protein